jgi:hypothetical protein
MTRPTYDVFLSHAAIDTGVAKVIRQAFDRAELTTFSFTDEPQPAEPEVAAREAIAECAAFVIILSRASLHAPSVAFELGAASAWNKPVFVLLHGISSNEVPTLLKGTKVRPLSAVDEVVAAVQKSIAPFSDEEFLILLNLYQKAGIPTDQLALEPITLGEITRSFNKAAGSNRTPERLLQELLRRRKQGKLPRLRRDVVHSGAGDSDPSGK